MYLFYKLYITTVSLCIFSCPREPISRGHRYLFYKLNMVAIPYIFYKFFCIKTLHGIAFSFRVSTLYNRFFINNCFSIRWQVINNNCYVDVIIAVICLCISVSKYLYFFSCPIAFCADLFTLSLLRPIFRYFSLIFLPSLCSCCSP